MVTDGADYARSAIKLLNSLRVNSDLPFDANILEVATKPLSDSARLKLRKAGWRLCTVDRIVPRDEIYVTGRYRDQYAKLAIWRMVEYSTALYLDSDCLVVSNIDLEFLISGFAAKLTDEFKIAAARDIAYGKFIDRFNMGVFAIRPNSTEFGRLISIKNDLNFLFDHKFSEQGFLNAVYKNQWFELDFKFNANLAAYSQRPEYWRSREKDISVIHYTMTKPWQCAPSYFEICKLWFKY
jgi:lipopolysaccharide biosynthesis glycosyltransferase